MDEAETGREHWKILLTSGMGFFTDASSGVRTLFASQAGKGVHLTDA